MGSNLQHALCITGPVGTSQDTIKLFKYAYYISTTEWIKTQMFTQVNCHIQNSQSPLKRLVTKTYVVVNI